jgi:hypothetical protein
MDIDLRPGKALTRLITQLPLEGSMGVKLFELQSTGL